MTFYYSIFAIICILSLIEILGLKKKQALSAFFYLSAFLFILSLIRWETGTDWWSYVDFYEHLPEIGEESHFEPLYHLVNYIGKHLFDSYTGVLFICASILFLFQSLSIYKLSIFPITTLFILYGASFGNVFFIRQTIATVILFYSIVYIQEKKFIKFIICVFIAMLFHYSSLIFLPAWWIFNWNSSKNKLLIFFLIALFTSILVSSFLRFLGNIIGGIIQYKISVYLDITGEESLQGTSFSLATMLLKGLANKAIILFPAILLLNKLGDRYQYYKGYLNLYWFGCILYFITAPISLILIRFSFAYDIVSILIIPLIIKGYKLNIRILIFALLALYLAMRLYVAINSYYNLFVPYKTIFEI